MAVYRLTSHRSMDRGMNPNANQATSLVLSLGLCFLVSCWMLETRSEKASDDQHADDPYPIKGLARRDIKEMLSVAATQLPADSTVCSLSVGKGQSLVLETAAPASGGWVRGDDFTYRAGHGKWELTGRTKQEGHSFRGGLSVAELISFGDALSFPPILSITVEPKGSIRVRTGHLEGRRAGKGKDFVFEKQEGKWRKVESLSWIA